MTLIKPTKKSISDYYKKYYEDDMEGFKFLYKSIFTLVDIYPSHSRFSHVLPKSIIINQLYSTNIMAIKKMAKHISSLNLKVAIVKGDADAIKQISTNHGIRSKKNNKEFDFYSFATKYCHSHNPSKYPIYDRNVDCILWEYKREDKFSTYKRKELKNYNTYLRVLSDFKEYYKLGEISSNKLDKFLWKQGAKFLKKKNVG